MPFKVQNNEDGHLFHYSREFSTRDAAQTYLDANRSVLPDTCVVNEVEPEIEDIDVPDYFVKLASGWYDGISDKLYAISSTGGLTMGSRRPYHDDDDRPMTDFEWHVSLFSDLSCDIGYAIRSASKERKGKKHKDYRKLVAFQQWADDTASKLREKYGLED